MDRFLHENIYRGNSIMASIRKTALTLCGIGAVGSNLAVNLARQGFGSLRLIDNDRIESRNLSTQIWSEAEVGLFKVECLRSKLFDTMGLEASIEAKLLTAKNAKRLLQSSSLLVDSFDNEASRKLVKDYSSEFGVPCLHVGLNGDYAEVIWNDNYRVPSEKGQDVCDYPLARNLILMAVAVASECIIRYITVAEKINYTITLGDFAIKAF